MMSSKERTYSYALKIINFIDTLPKEMSTKVISGQLLRAATSIGANIVEAQASPSRKDFTNFFNHALKSANETKYWLCLLRDLKKADSVIVNLLITEANEIAKILGSSIVTLKYKNKF